MIGSTSRQLHVWWVLLMVILMFFVIVLGINIPSPSNAQDAFTPTGPGVITLIADDFSIDIVRIWETDEADGERSDNDTFLVLEMRIHNNSGSDTCFKEGDFPAYFDGDESRPSNMRDVREEYYPDWDYPGSTVGQCIDGNRSANSFVSYDIDLDFTEFRLRFIPKDEQSSVFIWLEPLPDGEFSFGIQAPQRGESILSTFTPSPSPTMSPTMTTTPTTTRTPTPSNTPLPSATSDPNVRSTSGTRYINSSAGNVNIRSIPSTNGDIVGTLSRGDQITITGQSTNGQWYRIEFEDDEAWVFANLTSSTRPSSSSGGGGSSGGSGGTTPNPTSPAAVCDCSGDTLNCTNFNSHSAAQNCFNFCVQQGRGDIHRLDQDNDNIACESLP